MQYYYILFLPRFRIQVRTCDFLNTYIYENNFYIQIKILYNLWKEMSEFNQVVTL